MLNNCVGFHGSESLLVKAENLYRCLGIVEEKCNAMGSALTSAACKPFNS
jgi:hypothetical protein